MQCEGGNNQVRFNKRQLANGRATAREALGLASDHLKQAGISSAGLDAEVLICSVLGLSRTQLFVNLDRELSKLEQARLAAYVDRRKQRVPLQYVTGQSSFRYLDIKTDSRVLIPRPETELLVEAALSFLRDLDAPLVIDIGTGSGAIALSIARELPRSQVIAVDICPDALKMADENAASSGLGDHIQLVRSDLFKSLDQDLMGKVDAIISNPPYVESDSIKDLLPEIKDFEPAIALDGGRDGLLVIGEIVQESIQFLRAGGLMALEVGCGQAERVREIMGKTYAYTSIEIKQDYSGIDRIITAQLRS